MADSWTEDYVNYVASFSDSPRQYSRFCSWCVLGTALGKSIEPLRYGADDIRTNMWVVIIGPSSEARKSTQLKVARRVLRRAGDGFTAPQGGSYEGVLEHLADYPTICFFFDEFRRFMEWMSRDYNREMRAFFTEIYDWPADEDWVAVRAKGRGRNAGMETGIRIQGPAISMLSATTDEWLSSSIKPDDFTGGFLPRFVMVPFEEKKETYAYPPDRDIEWEARLIAQLAHAAHEKYSFTVGDRVRAHFAEWHREWGKSRLFDANPSMAPYFHRLTIYAWKIAMLEGVARSMKTPGVIPLSIELIDVGISAVSWVADRLAALMEEGLASGYYQERRRDTIRMIRKSKTWISKTELLRGLKLPARQLNEVIEALLEEERIVSMSVRRGRGRPSLRYRMLKSGEDWQKATEEAQQEGRKQ